MKIDASQRTASFQSLTQGRAFRRIDISNGFELGCHDFHCRTSGGSLVIFRYDDDFSVRTLAVEAFSQKFQAGTLAGSGDICADDVGFGNFRRVSVGVADFWVGWLGFVGNLTG